LKVRRMSNFETLAFSLLIILYLSYISFFNILKK
jgi:hypothetical protein